MRDRLSVISLFSKVRMKIAVGRFEQDYLYDENGENVWYLDAWKTGVKMIIFTNSGVKVSG